MPGFPRAHSDVILLIHILQELHIQALITHLCISKVAQIIASSTELPLAILDLRGEFLQQCFLHSPNRGRLSARLQSQLECADVFSANHKLIPLSEDSLTTTLTILLLALSGDGSVVLLLGQVERGDLRRWGILWGGG